MKADSNSSGIWRWPQRLRFWCQPHCPAGRGREATGRAVDGGIGRLFLAYAATLLAVAALTAAFRADAAPAEDAVASVERIFRTTIEAGASADLLASRLAPWVDLDALSRKVLGTAYGNASATDRREFDAVLLKVIALELAQRIRRAKQFDILGARNLRGSDVVVFSRLTKDDGMAKLLDWKMRPCGTRYCVYDLLSDRASFSASRRDQYAARLQAAGGSLANLTSVLRAEVAAGR